MGHAKVARGHKFDGASSSSTFAPPWRQPDDAVTRASPRSANRFVSSGVSTAQKLGKGNAQQTLAALHTRRTTRPTRPLPPFSIPAKARPLVAPAKKLPNLALRKPGWTYPRPPQARKGSG